MCNAHLCSVVGFSINHWLLEILAFIFFSFVLWILSTKYLGCWGCFFPTPLCSLLRNIYSFHFWREREGLGGLFHVVFYFVPLFLLPSTFLNKVISCSYRVGGEKIKMFIYFCWFPGDYIVLPPLPYIYIYVHPILAVEATACLSIKWLDIGH